MVDLPAQAVLRGVPSLVHRDGKTVTVIDGHVLDDAIWQVAQQSLPHRIPLALEVIIRPLAAPVG